MGRSVMSQFITITREEDKQTLMEQYKLLLESIHKLNDVREIANSFWIALNSALIGMVAYIRDLQSVGGEQKSFLLFTVLIFGFILTVSWLSYLWSIKKILKHEMT